MVTGSTPYQEVYGVGYGFSPVGTPDAMNSTMGYNLGDFSNDTKYRQCKRRDNDEFYTPVEHASIRLTNFYKCIRTRHMGSRSLKITSYREIYMIAALIDPSTGRIQAFTMPGNEGDLQEGSLVGGLLVKWDTNNLFEDNQNSSQELYYYNGDRLCRENRGSFSLACL